MMQALRTSLAISLLGALWSAQPASAQETAPDNTPSVTLTLRDALVRARDHVPSVRAALARARQARGASDVASSAFVPSVSASVGGRAAEGVSHGGFDAVDALSGRSSGTTWTTSYSGDASIDARWLIWDFGQTSANIRSAEASVDAAEADNDDTRRLVMNAAGAAFFTVLADQELVRVAEQTVLQRRSERDITVGLVQVGTRPEVERTRAEVALASAELDLQIAQGNLDGDLAALAVGLGMDPLTRLTLTPSSPLEVDAEPARAAQRAVAARPDLRAARARILEARENARAARAVRAPTLAANASLSGSLSDTSHSNLTESASGAIGASLSVPLVDSSISARTRTAEASAAVAEAAADGAVLSVRAEAVQAALAVRNARTQVAQAERLAESAAAELAQAQGRYRAGVSSLLEIVDASAVDASARITIVRLRTQLNLAIVRLLAATGDLDRLLR